MDKSRYETDVVHAGQIRVPSDPGERLAWFIDSTFQKIEECGSLPCPTYLAIFVKEGIKVGIGETSGAEGREAAVCSMLDANKGELVEAAMVFTEIIYLDTPPDDKEKAIISAVGLRGLPRSRYKEGLLVWVGRVSGGKRTVEIMRYGLVRDDKTTKINRSPVVYDESTERGRKYVAKHKVFDPLIDSTSGNVEGILD